MQADAHSLNDRLSNVKSRIDLAVIRYDQKQKSIDLLAVSKTRSAGELIKLYQQGQRDFGESYLQEALIKQKLLAHFDISWHFIGPIQSNKTKPISHYFSWVHSVDRLKIAERLNQQRPDFLSPLNICLQVNISQENTKSGFVLAELPEVIANIKELTKIKLRGVMAIPEPQQSIEQQRLPYQAIMDFINQHNLSCYFDTYSFGMSADLEAAIAEGSNLVRVGTDLFGPRPKKPT